MDWSDFKPYGSFLVLKSAVSGAGLIDEIWADIESFYQNRDAQLVGGRQILNAMDSGGIQISGCLFKEKKPVTWAVASARLYDDTNHFIVAATFDDFALVCFSDAQFKTRIFSTVINAGISGWGLVKENILLKAFVTDKKLKTLWLGGTHRSVDVKADSKILSGSDLNFAIDPLGDSTYMAGAVKSEVAGVSPTKSSIWLKPNNDWTSFLDQIQTIFALLIAAKRAKPKKIHKYLAQPIDTLSGVNTAYEFHLASIDTLSSQFQKKFTQQHLLPLDISLNNNNNRTNPNFTLRVVCPNGKAGNYNIRPEISGSLIKLNFDPKGGFFQKFEDALSKHPELFKVYYDSGHTISEARLGLSDPQDHPFDTRLWAWLNFSQPTTAGAGNHYNVQKEKPENASGKFDMAAIWTRVGEESLFSWFLREGLTELGLAQPDEPNKVWVYCDDGSGEVADFVHLDFRVNEIPTITLVHVKGASSSTNSRKVVPGPFEVVVSQAIKNLRALGANDLLKRVKSRLRVKPHERLWATSNDLATGPSGSHTAVISALNQAGSNIKHSVIILQPQVLRSKYFPSANGNAELNNVSARQLRVLLFSLQQSCSAFGADLRVVGVDDAVYP